jgi:hypothetical protein
MAEDSNPTPLRARTGEQPAAGPSGVTIQRRTSPTERDGAEDSNLIAVNIQPHS